MKNNLVQEKSYSFAVLVIAEYKQLVKSKREFVLSKQLLRSGTSIGANIEEAIGAHTRKDFIHKLSIAHKESLETKYWLRLLADTDFINKDRSTVLLNECR